MTDDRSDEPALAEATLADKYRMFLEGLSDEEFAVYRTSVVGDDSDAEVEGFTLDMALLRQKLGGSPMAMVFQDVTVNKAKTADKAYSAMDGYIRG